MTSHEEEMVELAEALMAAGARFEWWDWTKGWFFIPNHPNPTVRSRNGDPKPFCVAAVALLRRLEYVTGFSCKA